MSGRSGPLQNRVDPFGNLHAHPARGMLMGNRGGRFHTDQQNLRARRHVSNRWICCVCDFRGRQRKVWAAGYTEMFFLDEVTALGAGHRPCFECRRGDATRFADLFPTPEKKAAAMDTILHDERQQDGRKRLHRMRIDDMPDGAMFAEMDACFAVRGEAALRWSFDGYVESLRRPSGIVNVLTPPSVVETLRRGYAPLWHGTAMKAG
jgi:hypothetical protein